MQLQWQAFACCGSRVKRAVPHGQGFIREFFDQNPLSHLGLIVLRDGVAEKLTDLSGSPVRPHSQSAVQLHAGHLDFLMPYQFAV